jgi:DNA-binding NarL/FixJ family response regulator
MISLSSRDLFPGILSRETDNEVIEAHDACEALDAYAAASPDITVLDINLIGRSGFEVLQHILKREPKSRIMVFTMNEDPAPAAQAIEHGARGYITKSEDPSQFVKAVRVRQFTRNRRRRSEKMSSASQRLSEDQAVGHTRDFRIGTVGMSAQLPLPKLSLPVAWLDLSV